MYRSGQSIVSSDARRKGSNSRRSMSYNNQLPHRKQDMPHCNVKTFAGRNGLSNRCLCLVPEKVFRPRLGRRGVVFLGGGVGPSCSPDGATRAFTPVFDRYGVIRERRSRIPRSLSSGGALRRPVGSMRATDYRPQRRPTGRRTNQKSGLSASGIGNRFWWK
jgi:hypothetical protein